MNDSVREILKGSYDLHVHAGPDPTQERRLDALETARHAYEAEMGGFVLKSHHYLTAPIAHILNRMYVELKVVGSIALNHAVGGLNADAVETAANLGARVVWMPTLEADFHRKRQGHGPGIRLTNDAGGLREEVHDILGVVARHDMVLTSGHSSPSEVVQLFKAAKEKGVRRMMATHSAESATSDQQLEMASLGAYTEHTFRWCMPSEGRMSPQKMADSLKARGIEHCVVTTGLGRWMDPPPAEGMRMAIALLLNAGLEPKEVSALVKENPSQLLGFS